MHAFTQPTSSYFFFQPCLESGRICAALEILGSFRGDPTITYYIHYNRRELLLRSQYDGAVSILVEEIIPRAKGSVLFHNMWCNLMLLRLILSGWLFVTRNIITNTKSMISWNGEKCKMLQMSKRCFFWFCTQLCQFFVFLYFDCKNTLSWEAIVLFFTTVVRQISVC